MVAVNCDGCQQNDLYVSSTHFFYVLGQLCILPEEVSLGDGEGWMGLVWVVIKDGHAAADSFRPCSVCRTATEPQKRCRAEPIACATATETDDNVGCGQFEKICYGI